MAQKNLKKPAKPIFLRVSGKNKTKNFFPRGRGALIFGGLENKDLRPPPINNEPSLTLCRTRLESVSQLIATPFIKRNCSYYPNQIYISSTRRDWNQISFAANDTQTPLMSKT